MDRENRRREITAMCGLRIFHKSNLWGGLMEIRGEYIAQLTSGHSKFEEKVLIVR
jgi:hypothetical protein